MFYRRGSLSAVGVRRARVPLKGQALSHNINHLGVHRGGGVVVEVNPMFLHNEAAFALHLPDPGWEAVAMEA